MKHYSNLVVILNIKWLCVKQYYNGYHTMGIVQKEYIFSIEIRDMILTWQAVINKVWYKWVSLLENVQ